MARSGMINQGNYKYYKLQLACVEAAQALTFTLTVNDNRRLRVARAATDGVPVCAQVRGGERGGRHRDSQPRGWHVLHRRIRHGHGDVQAAREHKDVHREHPCRGFRADATPTSKTRTALLLENAMTVTGAGNLSPRSRWRRTSR